MKNLIFLIRTNNVNKGFFQCQTQPTMTDDKNTADDWVQHLVPKLFCSATHTYKRVFGL